MEESKSPFKNKETLRSLYKIVYPYGEFNGDYAAACIKIRKSLRELCKNNERNLLLVINRALDIVVSLDTTNKQLCKNLTKFLNICLSIDDRTSADFALYNKLKVLPIKNVDSQFKYEINDENFNDPFLANEDLKDFFKNINLGPRDPTNPTLNHINLNDLLLIGKSGIFSRINLILILDLYVKVNDLQRKDLKHKIKITPLMSKYLIKNKKVDPDNFGFSSLIHLIYSNVIKEKDLTPEEKKTLYSEATSIRLKKENILLNKLVSWHRKE